MIDNPTPLETDADEALDQGKTDEQLWNELAAEEPEPEPDLAQEDSTEETSPDEGAEAEETPDVADGNPAEDVKPQVERLRHQVQSEIGRNRGLARKVDTLQKENARLAALLNDTKTTAPTKEASEKLAKARSEYGDVIGPLADQIEANAKRVDRIAEIAASQLENNQSQLADLYQEQEAIFRAEHPEGHSVIHENKAVFDAWIEDQPKALRDAYSINFKHMVDGAAAALVVAEFKASLQTAANGAAPAVDSKSKLQARRDKQLAGSRSERSNGQNAVTSAPPADGSSDQAYWNYFEILDLKKG